jgi:hypothetical protein
VRGTHDVGRNRAIQRYQGERRVRDSWHRKFVRKSTLDIATLPRYEATQKCHRARSNDLVPASQKRSSRRSSLSRRRKRMIQTASSDSGLSWHSRLSFPRRRSEANRHGSVLLKCHFPSAGDDVGIHRPSESIETEASADFTRSASCCDAK